jgi:hypothetical protein
VTIAPQAPKALFEKADRLSCTPKNRQVLMAQQSQIGANDRNKSLLKAFHAIGTGRASPVVAEFVYLCGSSSQR